MVFKKKKPVQEEKPEKNDLERREGESAQEYNERVPVAFQPLTPGPTKNYLGEDRP